MQKQFLSLMYHNVCPDGQIDDPDARLTRSVRKYFVERSTFAEHMQVLADTCHVMDATDVRRFLTDASDDRTTAPLHPDCPSVQLTFDDGWRGTAEVAGPILQHYGLTAWLFITTDLIGCRGFLDAAELVMLPPDTFIIGSHAKTHRLLNELEDEEIRAELMASKETLEALLNRPVDTLSVPGGGFDRRVRDIAAECGYATVFTSEVRLNTRGTDPRNLGRIAVEDSTGAEEIANWIRGRIGRVRSRQVALRAAKRLLGPRLYRVIRGHLIGDRADEWDMVELAGLRLEAQGSRDGECSHSVDPGGRTSGDAVCSREGLR